MKRKNETLKAAFLAMKNPCTWVVDEQCEQYVIVQTEKGYKCSCGGTNLGTNKHICWHIRKVKAKRAQTLEKAMINKLNRS